MPLQNRVTPSGEIIAITQRGMFCGNRGIIHDPSTKTLLRRRWTSKAWITCLCEFQGRRRELMAASSWTELFFLDEAVALAAGHRPCFYCRRADANEFRAAWCEGNRTRIDSVKEMDAVLHAERQEKGAKRVSTLSGPVAALPTGTMVVAGDRAYTMIDGMAYRWTEQAYAPPIILETADAMLTPPSSVAALRAGYRPAIHPSAKNPMPGAAAR